jgi:hypothetical protein
MGAWDVLVGILEPVAVGLLVIDLGWAAHTRGRIHHYLAQQRRGYSNAVALGLRRPTAQTRTRPSGFEKSNHAHETDRTQHLKGAGRW